MATRSHHLTVQVDWDPTSKRWKLTYVVQLDRGVASHWRWIESSAPIDAHGASAIANAISREIGSWLF